MKLIIKPFHALPCELEVFTINGSAADYRDFGNAFDHNEKERKPYGCGNMRTMCLCGNGVRSVVKTWFGH